MPSLPLASVSLDLDDLWTYLKSHGDPGWESRPSYLSTFCPIILEELDRLDTNVTFFVVGADAARDENEQHFRSLAEAGHEMGTIPSSTMCGSTSIPRSCSRRRSLRRTRRFSRRLASIRSDSGDPASPGAPLCCASFPDTIRSMRRPSQRTWAQWPGPTTSGRVI